jgi:hypothetical protein
MPDVISIMNGCAAIKQMPINFYNKISKEVFAPCEECPEGCRLSVETSAGGKCESSVPALERQQEII